MSEPAPSSSATQPFLPLKRVSSPAGVGATLFGGVLLIAICARLDVPMVPVPMSLQTYAVVLLGAASGRRLGGAILFAYLASGALGVPVFAGGASGFQHLTGPTAGYLVGFLLAAVLVGELAERGWTSSLRRSISTMALGHALILGLGALVLGVKTHWITAYESGVEPFLLGALVKSILAATTLLGWRTLRPEKNHSPAEDPGISS